MSNGRYDQGHADGLKRAYDAERAGPEYVKGYIDGLNAAGVLDPDNIKDALSFALFALNTLAHPEASSAADVANLDANSDQVIATLTKLRDEGLTLNVVLGQVKALYRDEEFTALVDGLPVKVTWDAEGEDIA